MRKVSQRSLAKCPIRVYIKHTRSGYSAAWFSAFVWGTKGREFESRYPDHFFAQIPEMCPKII